MNLLQSIKTAIFGKGINHPSRQISPTYKQVKRRLPLNPNRERAIVEKFIANRIRYKLEDLPKELAAKAHLEETLVISWRRELEILKREFLIKNKPNVFDLAYDVVKYQKTFNDYHGKYDDLRDELLSYAYLVLDATPLTPAQMRAREAHRQQALPESIEREARNALLPQAPAIHLTPEEDAQLTKDMYADLAKARALADEVKERQAEMELLKALEAMPTTSEDIEIENRKRITDPRSW